MFLKRPHTRDDFNSSSTPPTTMPKTKLPTINVVSKMPEINPLIIRSESQEEKIVPGDWYAIHSLSFLLLTQKL
jgi:hypothetical protein